MLSFTENMVYACLRGGTVIDTVCYSSDTMHIGVICQFFPGGFITAIVVNPQERKLAKRTSVHCVKYNGLKILDWTAALFELSNNLVE